MEVEIKTKEMTEEIPAPLATEIGGLRIKTSQRMHYEAQVRVIRSQIGGLEKIRADLGLSQRKISQLLLVDPSAWTRWTRAGEEAPPHVWRALQWYLALKEKLPGLTPHYFTGTDPRLLEEKTRRQWESEKVAREDEVRRLEDRLLGLEAEARSLRRWLAFGSWILGLAVGFALWKAIR